VTDLTRRQIDSYRVDALVGEGGMGAVYRAYDLNLARSVAINVMHFHLARLGLSGGKCSRLGRVELNHYTCFQGESPAFGDTRVLSSIIRPRSALVSWHQKNGGTCVHSERGFEKPTQALNRVYIMGVSSIMDIIHFQSDCPL